MLAIAIGFAGDALAHSSSKLEKEISDAVDVATTEAKAMLDTCMESLDKSRNSNALLIETNARLTSQMDAGKLDSLVSGAELLSRLSECEFRTRELEDSITEKQNQISELEYEVETYSDEVRAALEQMQYLIERQKAGRAEADAIQEELHALADEFAVEFENSIREGMIAYELRPGYFSVTLRNALLFKPGGVDVTTKGKGMLRRVSGALKSMDNLNNWDITVSGHTDNIAPGKSLRKLFLTNWEMSQARAVNVVHYLVDDEGFEPARLGAKGYGEHRPEVSNKTRVGRAKNLRLVISVVRALDAPPALIAPDIGAEFESEFDVEFGQETETGPETGPGIGPAVEHLLDPVLEPEPQVQESN